MALDLRKKVGQRLQLLRKENNLTQEQMSDKLNLSTSAYCKLEYGETDITLTRLSQIANVFMISETDLLGKLEGNNYFNYNKDCSFVGVAQDKSIVNISPQEDIKEIVRANSRIVELLCKRLDDLEQKIENMNSPRKNIFE